MPFLDAYEGTQTVTVGDPARGYWVKLREHISFAAREDAEKALSQVLIRNQVAELRPDTTAYRQHMMLAHIADWNFDDANGKWPLTLENVKRIPGDEFDKLWKLVDEGLNPVEDAVERRQFPDQPDDGDPDR